MQDRGEIDSRRWLRYSTTAVIFGCRTLGLERIAGRVRFWSWWISFSLRRRDRQTDRRQR